MGSTMTEPITADEVDLTLHSIEWDGIWRIPVCIGHEKEKA